MITLLERFQQQAQYETATIDKFKQELDQDAAYALSWGDNVFRAAAKLQVVNEIINSLKDNATGEDIRASLMERVMHGTRFPSNSSSPTRNLVEQYTLSVCAEIVDDLRRYTLDN
jgi:hypothetical protein